MRPSARVQAAIDILDLILSGKAAEQALTGWARRSRFAGSKDRAAIRDYVFQAMRCKRSYMALGGAETGRGMMIGQARDQGFDLETLFDGQGYGAKPIARHETGRAPSKEEARDLPDWLWKEFVASLGETGAQQAAERLRTRAPITCRVNLRSATVKEVLANLSAAEVLAEQIDASDTALLVTEGERKLAQTEAYKQGWIELQDATSQAAMAEVTIPIGARVLDYCAGGGGKTLALAARADAHWFAHDIASERMVDLPERAKRAGVNVNLLQGDIVLEHRPFDVVLCDVPCSGSGTWRRTPEAKWRLTSKRLAELGRMQAEILEKALPLVRAGGQLIYATCSVLKSENPEQVAGFLSRHDGVSCVTERVWPISGHGDGFYLSVMKV